MLAAIGPFRLSGLQRCRFHCFIIALTSIKQDGGLMTSILEVRFFMNLNSSLDGALVVRVGQPRTGRLNPQGKRIRTALENKHHSFRSSRGLSFRTSTSCQRNQYTTSTHTKTDTNYSRCILHAKPFNSGQTNVVIDDNT